MVAATAFFGKTYGEAMGLLVEARNYVAYVEPCDRSRLEPAERLLLSAETLRLTARLTRIMAWLMAQRAVQAGEISRDEALGGPDRLAQLHICMHDAEGVGEKLPPRLYDLLDRSRRLYVRVARLDDLARRDPEPG